MTELAQQHAAADGTAPRLSDQEAQQRLGQVPDWSIENGKLTRDVKVKNFKEALALVNRVGELAEQENHHPDIYMHSWNHVRLELYTHTAHGISQNDFIMAAKFNQILSS
jgi:4a-hydroxytetrahydrobiopterin dehydratase